MKEEHKAADAAYRAKAEAARHAPIVGFPVRLRLPGERGAVDGLRIAMRSIPGASCRCACLRRQGTPTFAIPTARICQPGRVFHFLADATWSSVLVSSG